jgi:hypothetical protein
MLIYQEKKHSLHWLLNIGKAMVNQAYKEDATFETETLHNPIDISMSVVANWRSPMAK